MHPTEVFDQVEALYRHILALTLRQEACLTEGRFEELPGLAGEQMEILGRAQQLLGLLGKDTDQAGPAFQRGIQRLAAVLAEVMASEERCKRLAPASPSGTPPPPTRVLAAYGRR